MKNFKKLSALLLVVTMLASTAVFAAAETPTKKALPGKILSYDSMDNKSGSIVQGSADALTWTSWSQVVNGGYFSYKTVDDEKALGFKISPTATLTSNMFAGYFLKADAIATPYTGKIAVEAKVRFDGANDVELSLMNSTHNNLSSAPANANKPINSILAYDGSALTVSAVEWYTDEEGVTKDRYLGRDKPIGMATNSWATIRYEIDTDSKKYNIYVNEILHIEDASFLQTNVTGNIMPANIASMAIIGRRANDAWYDSEVLFDDIAVYDMAATEKYYYAEPVAEPAYSVEANSALADKKLSISVLDAEGADTSNAVKMPVRIADLDAKQPGVQLADIDNVNTKAVVSINKMVVTQEKFNYKQDYTNASTSVTGMAVTNDDGDTNKYLQITGYTDYNQTTGQFSVDCSKEFDFSFKVRVPNVTGTTWSNGYVAFQLKNAASAFLEFYFAPETPVVRYVARDTKNNTPFASNQMLKKNASNGIISSWDTTKWYEIKLHCENSKLSGTFDGTPIMFGGYNHTGLGLTNANVTELDVSGETFDRFAVAVRGASSNTTTIANFDDIEVDVAEVTAPATLTAMDAVVKVMKGTEVADIKTVTATLSDGTKAYYPIKSLTDNGNETYTAKVYGYNEDVILTIEEIDTAFSLATPAVSETGKVSVAVTKNVTAADGILIVATYNGNKMEKIFTMPVKSDGTVVTDIDAVNGARAKAFIWNHFSDIDPLAYTGEVTLNVPQNDLWKTEEYDVVCWGDSLTYGDGASLRDATNYPGVLDSLLNADGAEVTVKNMGIGGEKAQAIAARQGALTIYAKGPYTLGGIKGNSVTLTEQQFCDKTGGSIVPRSANAAQGHYGWDGICYLNDIPVKMTNLKVDNTTKRLQSVTFTREEDGAELAVKEGEARIFIPSGTKVKGDINVIYVGQNGWHDINCDGNITEEDLAEIVDKMIAYTANPDKCIILGLPTQNRETRRALEELFTAKYGSHYINLREIFSNAEYLAEKGVVVEGDDIARVANGERPSTLWKSSTDYVHMNDKGYSLVAELVYDKIIEMSMLS